MFTPFDILSIESWILLGTVVLLIRYYIHRKWQVLKELGIPHDPPSILDLGNLRTTLKSPQEFFKMDLEYKKKYGKIYGSYCGFEPRITIWDPQVLKQIQIKEFWNFPDRQRAFRKLQGKMMNNGLTVVGGDQWKRIRNTISPVFSSSKLKEMFGLFEQCTDHMIESLRKMSTKNDGKFDTKVILEKLSLEMVCSAVLGVNVHSQEQVKISKVLKFSKKRFGSSLFASPFTHLFLCSSSAEKIAELFNYSFVPRDVMSYFSSLINAMINNKKSPGARERVDILKCILDKEIDEKNIRRSTKGITRNEIVGNSMLMILGGYETIQSALVFLAYNLALYKECQDKLRHEITEAVDQHGSITYEAINSMKYLTMCINESIRIYPPAIRNSRLCEEEITIDGIRIPKGAHIDIPTYGMTRDPDYWDDPWEFKPERMEDMSKIDSIIFQPFGAGPRNCIAMRFALMEVKMAICKIIQNFQLDVADDTPKPPVDIIFRASMRPKADVLNLRAIALSD